MQQNNRINELAKVIGVTFGKSAILTSLNYDYIICASDEDEDGVGHIFALLLNCFELYWPELMKIGFVRRMTTPITRAIIPARNGKPKQSLAF